MKAKGLMMIAAQKLSWNYKKKVLIGHVLQLQMNKKRYSQTFPTETILNVMCLV